LLSVGLIAFRMKTVRGQCSAQRLLNVLVRKTILSGEHFDRIADEKIQKNDQRIKFHVPAPQRRIEPRIARSSEEPLLSRAASRRIGLSPTPANIEHTRGSTRGTVGGG
jgi:hypothetical protein